MPDLLRELARLGHVARVATLHSRGFSPSALRSALARGLVLRPRRGWIASPLADRDQLRAIAVGGPHRMRLRTRADSASGRASTTRSTCRCHAPRPGSHRHPRRPLVANPGVWHPSVPPSRSSRRAPSVSHRMPRRGCIGPSSPRPATPSTGSSRRSRRSPARSAAWTPSTRARRSTPALHERVLTRRQVDEILVASAPIAAPPSSTASRAGPSRASRACSSGG